MSIKGRIEGINYYEVGQGVTRWIEVHNEIEKGKLWAIVHDRDDCVWQVWVNGKVRSGSEVSRDVAEEAMRSYLAGEEPPPWPDDCTVMAQQLSDSNRRRYLEQLPPDKQKLVQAQLEQLEQFRRCQEAQRARRAAASDRP